jgi:hypothetical protein
MLAILYRHDRQQPQKIIGLPRNPACGITARANITKRPLVVSAQPTMAGPVGFVVANARRHAASVLELDFDGQILAGTGRAGRWSVFSRARTHPVQKRHSELDLLTYKKRVRNPVERKPTWQRRDP